MIDNRSHWYNYRTREYDYIETPSDFSDYIPQSDAAQNLYRLRIEHFGETPLIAAKSVLEVVTGKKGQV